MNHKTIALPAFLFVFLLALGNFPPVGQRVSAHPSWAEVDLVSFGARPNDPRFNSRASFQQAFAKLASLGGGALLVPAGDYYLDFPDIASDVDPHEPGSKALLQMKNLKKEKLILVPEGVIVKGAALDSAGNPTTRIHWNATGFPLLTFVSSDNSGAENLAFVFDGVQPQFFPWAQEDLFEAVGYKSRWLGGPYEISAVIYTIGSSNLHFTNLTFQSGKTPADNEHTFAFGIVLKGKSPVPQPESGVFNALPIGTKVPGGGLSECVSANTLQSLRFQDFVMGILASGQCKAVFENIEGNNRGSWYRSMDPLHESGPQIAHIGPPGHLIYITTQDAYDVLRSQDAPAGLMVFHSTTRNKNLTIRNVKEGPDTLSIVNSLGTLALKNMDGGLVTDVVSRHPIGLIQTMIDAHDVQLENLSWSSDVDTCSDKHTQTRCGTPVIGLEPGPEKSGTQFSSGLKFKNITLEASHRQISFKISQENGQGPLSQGILVDGLTIICYPIPVPNQGSPPGIITVRAIGAHFTNARYLPQITGNAPAGRQSYAAIIENRSSDSTVDVAIKKALSLQGDKEDAYKCVIDGQGNQSQDPKMNNNCRSQWNPAN